VKAVDELDEVGVYWDFFEFLDQPVVSDPVEGPLYVQEDGKSVLLQIGMSGGVRVKLKDGVDGGAFRPESELLRWEEVVDHKEIF
jgi:hypothetical protein